MGKFSPFVLSIDVVIGKETLVFRENLSSLMAVKMEESSLHIQGWVNGWIAIAFARSYFCMIRRYFLPSTLQDREP